MRVLWQDLRFAARLLRSNPGFTALAVLSLALGIGVNTGIFSLVRAVLRPPSPIRDAGRLVSVYHSFLHGREVLTSTSYPDYEYYRDHNRVLSGLMAYCRVPMSARIGEQAEQISGELVTANYFSVLDLRASAGRTFLADDRAVAVIGDRLWRSRFGGDRNVLGRTVGIGRHVFTIVGIAPPGFRGVVLDWGDPPELWVPMAAYREAVPLMPEYMLQARHAVWLLVTGRLQPGVSMAEAKAAFHGMAGQLAQAYGENPHDWSAEALPLSRARFWPTYRNSIMTFLGLLVAVTGLVLLIACFNVANLLLTRAMKRQREIAVRLALGAGRGRLVRQLTTESVLLSLVGGAAGIAVAWWTAALVRSYPQPFKIPLALDTPMDAPALGFALLLSLVTGVLFGIVPARRASRPDLVLSLKSEAPGPGLRGFALRNAGAADRRGTLRAHAPKGASLRPGVPDWQCRARRVKPEGGGISRCARQAVLHASSGADPFAARCGIRGAGVVSAAGRYASGDGRAAAGRIRASAGEREYRIAGLLPHARLAA